KVIVKQAIATVELDQRTTALTEYLLLLLSAKKEAAPHLVLLRASPFNRLRRGSKVWVAIAEATIAGEHIRSTLLKRTVLTIPNHTVFANRDHSTPRSLSFCWLQAGEHTSERGGGN